MSDYWAKTGAGTEYLTVERHALDAAAVAARLFEQALTAAQRAWIADDLGVDIDHAARIVQFLAGSHDVGKIGPFQHLVPELADLLGTAALSGFAANPIRHERVSGVALDRFVRARGGSIDLAARLVATVAGHHSVPSVVGRAERSAMAGLEAWCTPQDELLARIAEATSVGSLDGVTAPSHAVVLFLAGLVSVSDWNASDTSRFPVMSGERAASAVLADDAILPEAWGPRAIEASGTFSDTFGLEPRAAQSAVVEALSDVRLPALFILEDRTGAGKTEAALWVARTALECGARGLYVGLPTRATASQFHARAQRFLARLWADHDDRDLRLLHGGMHLTESDPLPAEVGRDAPDGEVAARAWFDGARRGLLSPYAVGTIDQALLGVLGARFYPVRLWGLAGKVVVIDEAHAYDSYTGGLLRSLVSWLAALRCTVVLLSATLPRHQRDVLTAAYRDGLRGTPRPRGPSQLAAAVEAAPYPRLTIAASEGARVVAVDDDRPGRRVVVHVKHVVDDAEAVARCVEEELCDGGCVGVVCSTVAIAQQRYAAIAAAVSNAELLLLHSRIRPLERAPIEKTLVEWLGPQATGAARPPRLVVVATQIIEQSLDLDFDVVMSDLAPVDLLIQRAGRIHRHAGRGRPARHAAPRLVMLDTPPDLADGYAATRPRPAGAGSVYAAAVLARTRVALRGRAAIDEPSDLDVLIATVYDSAVPSEATAEERTVIGDLDADAARRAREHAEWARQNGIGEPQQEDPPWERGVAPIADDDVPAATPRNAAATRWSERPSVDVVVLRADEAHLSDQPLTRPVARALLQRAVAVTHPALVGALAADPEAHRPAAWKRHGALRHHFLVVLGATDLSIDWHPVLGVTL